MTPTSTNLKPKQVQEQLSAEQLQLRDLLSPVLNPNQEIGLMCGCLAVFTLPESPAESDNPLDHAPSYFELEGPATDPQMAYELTLTAAEYWRAQASPAMQQLAEARAENARLQEQLAAVSGQRQIEAWEARAANCERQANRARMLGQTSWAALCTVQATQLRQCASQLRTMQNTPGATS